jgi:hypothetical protein
VSTSQTYVAVALVVLLVVALLVFAVGRSKPRKPLTPLAGLALACVLAGIVLGAERLIGYGLLAIGVVLAVWDMLRKAAGR